MNQPVYEPTIENNVKYSELRTTKTLKITNDE